MKQPYRLRRRDLLRLFDLRTALRVIGGGLIGVPLLMVFPMVGAGTGKSYEPGSDMARSLSLSVLIDTPWGIAMLVLVGLGGVLIGMSFLVPE
jgi:hypothetical protein